MGFALENQGAVWVISGFCAHMLDFVPPGSPQIVEAQAILLLIHFIEQTMLEPRPLCGVDHAFEN